MVVTCPLCGYRFDPGKENVCEGCPINSKCDRICCPNCRYGWVTSSTIVDFISKLVQRGKGKHGRSQGT